MLDAPLGGVLEPVAGALHDVELAVGVVGRAVLTRLVVRAGTVHVAVVLRHVEVDRPGAEFVGHLLVGGVELGVGVAGLYEGMFRRVVAEQVEIGVGEIGLEAERLRHANLFEKVENILPGMHPGPADLTFGSKPLAVVVGDLRRLAKGLGNLRRIGLRILPPLVDAKFRRVDPDHAILPHTVLLKDLRDPAGHLHGGEKLFCRDGIAHRRVADGARPDRCHEGADREAVAGDLVGDHRQFRVARFGVRVRQKQEVVDAVELLAIHIRSGGQFQHPIKADRRLLTGVGALADEAGPHGVVKFWGGVRWHCGSFRKSEGQMVGATRCRRTERGCTCHGDGVADKRRQDVGAPSASSERRPGWP